MNLVPNIAKRYRVLSHVDIIKQNYGIGIKHIFIKNVHFESVAGEIVIISNYCILIKSIGFEIFESDAVFTDCQILLSNNFRSVIDNGFKRSA